ncbi:MAG: hypothetical protein ACOC56_05160 [Atribacterota bacterium]
MNVVKEINKRGGHLRLIRLSILIVVLLFVALAGYWLFISPETFLERMISIGDWLLSLFR